MLWFFLADLFSEFHIGTWFSQKHNIFLLLYSCCFKLYYVVSYRIVLYSFFVLYIVLYIVSYRIASYRIVLFLYCIVLYCNPTYFLPVVPHKAGGGSFKNRKPIGEVGCCESGDGRANPLMDRKVLEVSSLSLSFSDYLPTYLSIFYVSIYLSILSLSLSSV